MSDFKLRQRVKASTVRGARKVAGTVSAVRRGARGAWYEVKPDNGDPKFCTRAAYMKPA